MWLQFQFVLFILTVWCYTDIFAAVNRIRRQSANTYGITNFEINESVRRLEKSFRTLEDKLSRHEFREVQVADFSTKTLNALSADHGLTQKELLSFAKQLVSMEERMMSVEALISMTDERQRKKLDALGDGLNRLLMAKPKFDPGLPAVPAGPDEGDDVGKEVRKVLRRVNVIDEAMKRLLKNLSNEISIVGESLSQHMKQLNSRHDRIWTDWNTCQKEQIYALTAASNSLSQTGALFSEEISEAKKLIGKGGKSNSCDGINKEVAERLESLSKAYQDQEKELETLNHNTNVVLKEQQHNFENLLLEAQNEKSALQNFFSGTFEGLTELNTQSKKHLGELEATLKNIVKENSQDIRKRVDEVSTTLKEKSTNIINALDDAAGMSENLQSSMGENFEDLTKDIKGLKKVEQVMLSTADAVLDTKRSIEFGIQQVILELSDTVKNSGKNINSTLSDQINNISFAILKNQTSALTNMTSKMENEISQVWRQIAIMYQQISQSVDLLDDLKSTTSQQMNASLDKVGSMDGTVGAINNKVADVEDNLNYLLGRLSLVVSEFSHMKTGVGTELEKLREMAQGFSTGDVIEYQVNKKRSLQDGNNFKDDKNSIS